METLAFESLDEAGRQAETFLSGLNVQGLKEVKVLMMTEGAGRAGFLLSASAYSFDRGAFADILVIAFLQWRDGLWKWSGRATGIEKELLQHTTKHLSYWAMVNLDARLYAVVGRCSEKTSTIEEFNSSERLGRQDARSGFFFLLRGDTDLTHIDILDASDDLIERVVLPKHFAFISRVPGTSKTRATSRWTLGRPPS